ncbi:hypothetical protein Clacol_006541 [Clathrus columnatus]|uniref:polynucleotide adenylyltransferase n=1 Tax=Clathrus columnatus TaxID=1419009 RepID=A0AAV5AD46_9AGAM|nr:hypothetical protein Clacol_006541 [Clathrus columnatus]
MTAPATPQRDSESDNQWTLSKSFENEMSDSHKWPNDNLTSPTNLASTSFNANEDYIAFGFSDVEDYANDSFVASSERQIEAELSRKKAKGKRTTTEVDDGGGDDGYRNKKRRMDSSNSRSTPWVDQVDWSSCRNLAEMLHKEVRVFVNYISPTFEEHEVRGMIITSITRAIRSSWPDARVSPFGSYETKLYLPLGDIDLVIESRAMENHDKRRILYSLAHVLRKANITSNVQVIAKAKVPIVKFVTLHGRFSVDISLNQTNGLRAGSMINRLLAELPAVHPLVMTIKLFLNQRSMNEVYTGGLGSYALVCMVVSFLQMHPKIRAGEIDPMQNLGVLVIEFFELYGHFFNYEKTGISIRDGGTYFDKIARDWDDPRNPALLSIEDPVDITNDVSKNSFNMPRVRKTLAGAHEVLTAAAFMRCRVLMSKSRSNHRQERDLKEQSILGSVMGVTQEISNHRRMVKQLYDRGILQNLLGIISNNGRTYTKTLRQTEALEVVEQAWRNNSDIGEESESEHASGSGSQGNSDTEETSRYSVRSPPKRRRIGSLDSFGRKEMNAIYVAESEDGEVGEDESEAGSTELILERPRPVSKPSSFKSDSQARRAYWASKGLSGGPEEGRSLSYQNVFRVRTPTAAASSTLKERIAALQQRSTSPQLSSPPRKTASETLTVKNTLRDKIARFEEKGSTTSKSRGTIGIGKPKDQLNIRVKSLGRTLSEQASPHSQSRGYSRIASDTHKALRDSTSSPTSSYGDNFSEMYEEDSQAPSSVLHSPVGSHFSELEDAMSSNSHDDGLGIHSAPTVAPLIIVDGDVDPLINKLQASNLESHKTVESLQINQNSRETSFPSGAQETINDEPNRSDIIPKKNYPLDVDLQALVEKDGGNSSTTESPIIVAPILDAFPTVPEHIPSSLSSSTSATLQQNSAISAFNRTSISSIHSIPSSLPSSSSSSSASSYLPAVPNSTNNSQSLAAVPRPFQDSKSRSRPKSSVPFWYDDDSDEGEPGWVSVTVTTRRY